MSKYKTAIAVLGILAIGALVMTVSGKTAATSGSWQVDPRHSDAQLITDGTTDFGRQKVNFTLGFARINGTFKIDDADPANSKLDLHIYPANSDAPILGEDGKLKAQWLANLANHTLMCFHSKKIVRTPDGKLQVTGDLVITRIDRNVDIEPTEAYSGPVYGPPIVHRVVREATFVVDLSGGNGPKDPLRATGSTSVSREGFPELVRAVVATNWPPLVMDEKCTNPSAGTEDYRGFRCTGTFMEAQGLPPAPTQIGEDYPGPSDYNSIVGNQLTIMVNLRLAPGASAAKASGSM
jgi:polyisoprenoid-binding protein YceI